MSGSPPQDPADNLILLSTRRAPVEPPAEPDELSPPDTIPAEILAESSALEEGLVSADLVPPDPAFLPAAIESVLFTLTEPLAFDRLRDILCGPDRRDLEAALRHLQAIYDREGHGIRLVEVAGGWQIRTHVRFATWVARARGGRPLRLSQAALETLAIVAWRQPVTRAEIEDIRGVEPGPVLRLLLEKGLVRSLGHRDEPGRPLTFGTTARFLETFGLKDLSDLPTLREYQELLDPEP